MDVNIEKTAFVQGENSQSDADIMLSLTTLCFDISGLVCRRRNKDFSLYSEQLVS